jgi:predicted unusual protein kinase regulating ubiquinone biosynthesis (AarF/ABC1/UbiB family)
MALEAWKKASDTARRSGQLMRIAHAARRVGNAGDAMERDRARNALAALLGDARGIPMKVGQFLSQGEDGRAYEALRASAEPLPLCDVRDQIEASLGAPIEAHFSEFDESTAAASLGQVHRARLLDGREVAVKVRYPGIVSQVEAELRLAGLIPGIGPAKRWGFDVDGYRSMLGDDLSRELDYRIEAKTQERAGNALQIPGLVVPKIISELCREDLLVQVFEGGSPITMFARISVDDRRAIAKTLLATLFRSLFCTGELHADPHFGNLAVRQSGRSAMEVVVYDWGCTVPLSLARRQALLKVILACREKRDIELMSAYVAMGFDGEKLSSIANSLPALSAMLLEPFLLDRALNTKTWNLSKRFEMLLGEHRWWFRSAGPPDSVLLLRAIHGVFCQLEALQIAIPWWTILQETLGEETMNAARQASLPPLDPTLRDCAQTLQAIAKSLKVQVLDHGKEKVSISMPAEAALDLQGIVPEDLVERVEKSGVDFALLVQHIRETGIAPQALLDIEDGSKHFRVWLE